MFKEINFEFAPPGTPKQYGITIGVLGTLYSCIRVIRVHAELHEDLKTDLCPKVAATTDKLENILV